MEEKNAAQSCFYLLSLKDMGIALELFKLSQILSLIYRTKYNLSDVASFFVWILSVFCNAEQKLVAYIDNAYLNVFTHI
ncbi:hypothetical protein C9J48_02265 [Photobacterium profundum]|uniref:Uncharacterized protein n=1 Tax=Photobacterium profundum 3TCK TaxID=314280 RepID=Q1Z0W8_9GAMM|nr:hypothetical protein P3TCK_16969 [Photobacterium profundum 3TCK]PSV64296.1 hypothetical protein C9J48_02265 [Photobacterium profundum]